MAILQIFREWLNADREQALGYTTNSAQDDESTAEFFPPCQLDLRKRKNALYLPFPAGTGMLFCPSLDEIVCGGSVPDGMIGGEFGKKFGFSLT